MSELQKPIPSGFGFDTTAEEALGGTDLTGKNAIVTGGYSGIGLETTRVLAKAGAHVIVPARRPDLAREALAGIPNVELAEMDLSDPVSIDRFTDGFLATDRALHLVICNAGIMATPLMRDKRGYELQFAVNHLGHYQLVAHVLPSLVDAHGARVVVLSSAAHHRGGVDFDDINFERRDYDRFVAYGQSKTANALFAFALDIVGDYYGINAYSVHPGVIHTNLARHLTEDDIKAFGSGPSSFKFKTVEQGAATTVWAATSPQLRRRGGVYCEDVDIAREVTAESTESGGVKPWAIDPEAADRLWWLTRDMTGVRFGL